MPTQRFTHLDGLRGYAALIVVIHHFIAGFWPAAYFRGGSGLSDTFSETPLLILINGPFSVFVFFVLSGYVLSGNHISSCSVFSRHIVARYIRLGIPAGVSIVIAYVILLSGLTHAADAAQQSGNMWLADRFPADDYPWWKATAHAAGAYFITGSSVLNQVLWTMRTEFFGSMAIFMVGWIFQSPKIRLYIYIALAAITIALSNFKEILYFVPFFAGSIMRESGFTKSTVSPTLTWPLLFIGLILGGTPYTDPAGTIYEPVANIIATFHQHPLEIMKVTGSILLVFSIISIKFNFLETGFSAWLGKISFSSYLIHLLVLVSFTSYLFEKLGSEHLIIQAMIYLIAVWVLASVFYRFIEAPAIAWSRKIRN